MSNTVTDNQNVELEMITMVNNPINELNNSNSTKEEEEDDVRTAGLCVVNSISLDTATNADEDRSSSNVSSKLHDNIASDTTLSPIGSLYSLGFFLLLSSITTFLYVMVDVQLADPITNNNVKQNDWESRWWSVPRIQSIFVIVTLCSLAELTLTCARNNRKRRMADRLSLDVMFVLVVTLMVVSIAYPKIFQKELKSVRISISRGNCTDPHKEVKDFSNVCPTFTGHPMIQQSIFSEQVKKNESKTNDNVNRFHDVKNLYQAVEKMSEYAVLFTNVDTAYKHEVDHAYSPKWSETIRKYPNTYSIIHNPKCIYNLVDQMCEALFTRCMLSDCSKLPGTCHETEQLKKWIACNVKDCERKQDPSIQDCSIPYFATSYLFERLAILLVEDDSHDQTNKRVSNLVSASEFTLLISVLRRLQQKGLDLEMNADASSCEWNSDRQHANVTKNDPISCNINVTTYIDPNIMKYEGVRVTCNMQYIHRLVRKSL
jgi:hypothetical protein